MLTSFVEDTKPHNSQCIRSGPPLRLPGPPKKSDASVRRGGLRPLGLESLGTFPDLVPQGSFLLFSWRQHYLPWRTWPMGSSSVPTPGPEPRRPHPRSPRPLFLTPQGKTERQQVRTRPIHGEQVTLKVGRATDAIIHVSFCRSWSPNVSVTTSNHFRFCFVQNHLGCIHLHPKGPDFDEVTGTAVLCLGLSCSTRTYIWDLMRRDRTEIPSNIFHWSCYLYHPGVSFRIFFLWGDTYPINHVAVSFYLYLNIPSVVWEIIWNLMELLWVNQLR